MQAIDEASEYFELFKKLGVLQVLDTVCPGGDQELMSQFTRAEANMKVSNEYTLTWDACDLILNKLPNLKHSELEKVGFIKDLFYVCVLVCVWCTVCCCCVGSLGVCSDSLDGGGGHHFDKCCLLRFQKNRSASPGVTLQADLVQWLESVTRPYIK